MGNKQANLKGGARFTLFVVSYLPLFGIMAFSQLYNYKEYLNWGGINLEAITIFVEYFSAISVLIILSIVGLIGLFFLLKNIDRRTETNGDLVTIVDIENKNSESISYLFTYIIPFVFQDLSELVNVVSVSVLLIVTFLIYSNSSMLLINPTISIKYSLYMVEYNTSTESKNKKGMILSKNKFLEEDDKIKINKLGHKLFYAIESGS